MVLWNLINKMTIEVSRKFDMYMFDIMLNHSYFPIMKYVQHAAYRELCSKIISIPPMMFCKFISN